MVSNRTTIVNLLTTIKFKTNFEIATRKITLYLLLIMNKSL
jgi:hypothetical protein